jgi:hypothetical protein
VKLKAFRFLNNPGEGMLWNYTSKYNKALKKLYTAKERAS